MSLTVAYGALLTGVLVWVFLVRKFTAKPWDANSPVSALDAHAEGVERPPPARMGLRVFMAVMTSLFGLFISAYYMRMGHGHGADAALNDWGAIAESPLLWLNSLLLVFSSIAMQGSRAAMAQGNSQRTQRALLLGGLFALAFIVGQLLAWRDLRVSEYFTPRNPAIAFFYLLTAVHGLHLLGGLYVWGKTYWRLRVQRAELIDVRLSVELCTVYWHFLLLVWVVLFGLLLAT
ncbi:MAG TPA: cytochrome c oxidase subunit 3 [Roseiflexaceae bacterium]|nr:cytochrome c oxidase subunit 3 [Roseiflexaceae bacterium]